MSKGPSPRIDQIRALREARFARNVAREKEATQPVKPATAAPPVAATKQAAAEEPVKAAKPAAAKSAPAKRATKTPVKKAKKKKSGKAMKTGK